MRRAAEPDRAGGSRPLRARAGNTLERAAHVALLPSEPEGLVCTRTAGAVEVRARLAWRPASEPSGATALPALPELSPSRARLRTTEALGPEDGLGRLAAEVLALTERDLGAAVERVLRAVSEHAARTDAVLEASAVRVAAPRVAPARALEELALELWGAGFRVSFGPCWSPAPEAAACVGCGEPGSALAEYLRSHPSWRTVG